MALGQLIEYNIRNIFLERSYTKYSEEAMHKLFSKKLKLTLSLDQLKFDTVSFDCMPN